MKKIFTSISAFVITISFVFSQSAVPVNQEQYFNHSISNDIVQQAQYSLQENLVQTKNSVVRYVNVNKTGKISSTHTTTYNVNLATAFATTPGWYVMYPDSNPSFIFTGGAKQTVGEVTDGGSSVGFNAGQFAFATIFDPNEQVFDATYTGGSGVIGFDAGNDFVVDSVSYLFSYTRAIDSGTDTLYSYILNNAAIVGKAPLPERAALIDIPNSDLSPNTSAGNIIKIDTVLLDATNDSAISINSISFPAQTLSGDEQLVLYTVFKPHATAMASLGDTIFDANESTSILFKQNTNNVWLSMVMAPDMELLAPTGRTQINFAGQLMKYPAAFGMAARIFNQHDFIPSPAGYGAHNSVWSVTPIGIAVVASNNPTNTDCRTVTFVANDNFNADEWTWNFGDGSADRVTATNSTTYTYANPSAAIPVTCTAEDTATGKTFVATVNTPNLTFCTGIEESILGANVGLYPNPATDLLTININSTDAQDLNVSIIDILGVSVYSNALSNVISYNNDINIAHLASGIYFIEVSNEKGAVVKKLIIE